MCLGPKISPRTLKLSKLIFNFGNCAIDPVGQYSKLEFF